MQVRRCYSAHPAIDGRKFLQRHKDWLAHDLTDVPSSLGHADSGCCAPLLAYPCQLVRQASAWPLGHCHITRISVSSVCSQHSGVLDSRCMKGVCRALQGAHSGIRLGLLASERVRQLQRDEDDLSPGPTGSFARIFRTGLVSLSFVEPRSVNCSLPSYT